MVTAQRGMCSTTVYISVMRYVFLTFLFLIIQCNRPADIEYCFSTMVNGRVAVDCEVGKVSVPCGVLSAFGGPNTNEGFDFEAMKDLCGKSASGYNMLPPDSAFLDWSFVAEGKEVIPENVIFYKKKIKLPTFPKRKWGQSYRVSFMIAYGDSVYVRVETVDPDNRSVKEILEDMNKH
jgi:hypothetical protein